MQARFEINPTDDGFELLIAVETEYTGEVMRRHYATREEAEDARDKILAELEAGPPAPNKLN